MTRNPLSRLYDECIVDQAGSLEAQGKDLLMSEVRERAFAEFLRRHDDLRRESSSEVEDQEENTRASLRLLKSGENGTWYALDDSGQTITHGHRRASQCVHAAMRVPYTPKKFV